MIYTARIEVEDSFCDSCSTCIKNGLQEIKEIKNINLYPKESLITFNFMKVNNLSTVLNVLTDMGYREKGERYSKQACSKLVCDC